MKSRRPGGWVFFLLVVVAVDVCTVSHSVRAKLTRGFDVAVWSDVTSCLSPKGRRGIPIQVSYFPGEYSHHQATGQLRVVSLPSLVTLLLCQE